VHWLGCSAHSMTAKLADASAALRRRHRQIFHLEMLGPSRVPPGALDTDHKVLGMPGCRVMPTSVLGDHDCFPESLAGSLTMLTHVALNSWPLTTPVVRSNDRPDILTVTWKLGRSVPSAVVSCLGVDVDSNVSTACQAPALVQ
jgi:hypothetical protein